MAPAARTPAKAAVAAEAWARLGGYFARYRGHVQQLLAETGLSFGDLRALTVLEADRPQPMRALAEAWACDASNATWMVDRLEERGLVARRPLPGDRRVKAVALTGAGVAAKAALLERLAQPPPELLGLTRAQLVALRDALGPLAGASPPGSVSSA